MSTIILNGEVCTNTCLGYSPGDDTPDYLALFGPAFGDLMGKPVQLVITDSTHYSLTIGGHTLAFDAGNPHYSVSFDNPLLASYPAGSALFTATGINPYGFAVAEAEYLCLNPPVPGVPEPATWMLLLLGFAAMALTKWARTRFRPKFLTA